MFSFENILFKHLQSLYADTTSFFVIFISGAAATAGPDGPRFMAPCSRLAAISFAILPTSLCFDGSKIFIRNPVDGKLGPATTPSPWRAIEAAAAAPILASVPLSFMSSASCFLPFCIVSRIRCCSIALWRSPRSWWSWEILLLPNQTWKLENKEMLSEILCRTSIFNCLFEKKMKTVWFGNFYISFSRKFGIFCVSAYLNNYIFYSNLLCKFRRIAFQSRPIVQTCWIRPYATWNSREKMEKKRKPRAD